MILSVTQVQVVVVVSKYVADPLGMMELSFLEIAIDKPNFTISYYSHAIICLLINQDQSIIPSVRYHYQIMI